MPQSKEQIESNFEKNAKKLINDAKSLQDIVRDVGFDSILSGNANAAAIRSVKNMDFKEQKRMIAALIIINNQKKSETNSKNNLIVINS
mgnify:CR=1 FL=1